MISRNKQRLAGKRCERDMTSSGRGRPGPARSSR
jgi:hypothetical protein